MVRRQIGEQGPLRSYFLGNFRRLGSKPGGRASRPGGSSRSDGGSWDRSGIPGSPPGIPGSTNALRLHQMGDAVNEVAPAYHR